MVFSDVNCLRVTFIYNFLEMSLLYLTTLISLVHLSIQSDRVSYNVKTQSICSEQVFFEQQETADGMQILMLWPPRKFWGMDAELLRLNCNGLVGVGPAGLLLALMKSISNSINMLALVTRGSCEQ